MALMHTGQRVKSGVPVSVTARRNGQGHAVFTHEEDNVHEIVSRRAAQRRAAQLMLADDTAKTGGWFLVTRNLAGDWIVGEGR